MADWFGDIIYTVIRLSLIHIWITMQEKGVSTLVSVDLLEDELEK